MSLISAACDLSYPEVVVVNQIGDQVQLRNISFNGCVWDGVLAHGEATTPGRCLPGEDRVHFERFDAAAYNQKLADFEAGRSAAKGIEEEAPVPTWFNYQTVTLHRVDYGQFRIFEINLDDLEQDFSVPGPYGH